MENLSKKEQVINSLKKEIENYKREKEKKEYDLKHRRRIIARDRLSDKLYSSALFGKFILPYVLATGLTTFGFLGLANVNPFSKTEKNYLKETTSFDSNGNMDTEKTYLKLDSYVSEVTYCSAWTKNEDGIFTRTVNKYNVYGDDIDKIISSLNDEDTIIKDILKRPNESYVETKTSLTEKELSEGEYYEGTIYNVDKNEYIVVDKQPGTQLKQIIAYIVVLIITNAMANFISLYKWSVDCEFDGEKPFNGEAFLDSLGKAEFPQYDKEYLRNCIQEYEEKIKENSEKIKKLELSNSKVK